MQSLTMMVILNLYVLCCFKICTCTDLSFNVEEGDEEIFKYWNKTEIQDNSSFFSRKQIPVIPLELHSTVNTSSGKEHNTVKSALLRRKQAAQNDNRSRVTELLEDTSKDSLRAKSLEKTFKDEINTEYTPGVFTEQEEYSMELRSPEDQQVHGQLSSKNKSRAVSFHRTPRNVNHSLNTAFQKPMIAVESKHLPQIPSTENKQLLLKNVSVDESFQKTNLVAKTSPSEKLLPNQRLPSNDVTVEEGEVMNNCSITLSGCECHNYTGVVGIVCQNFSDMNTFSRNVEAYFKDYFTTFELNFKGGAGEYLPPGALQNLIVYQLIIEDPNMKGFAPGTMEAVTRLRRIDVRRSAMVKVPDVRPVRDRMTHLWIQRSQLKRLDGDGLKGLYNLKSVAFAYNHIEYVSPDLFQNTNAVQVFDISRNKLVSLPSTLFDSWPQLRKVDLSHNQLLHLNRLFAINHPKFIFMDFNNLTQADDILYPNMTAVETLQMGSNPFRQLSPSTFNGRVPMVRFIYLDNCGIDTFDVDYFRSLDKLTALDLSFNDIEVVQEQFVEFGENLDIDFSNNRIRLFKASISHLVKRLFLKNNQLVELGQTLQRTQLEQVSVSGNYLKHLTDNDMKHAHGVQVLELNNNSISRIDSDTFEKIRNDLQYLDMSNNLLQNLNSSIRFLSQLKRLDINHNRIQKLGEKEFAGLNELSELYMGNNHLLSVGMELTVLPQMQLLDIRFNNLSLVSDGQFPASVRYVYLSGNPFNCNCHLLPLLEWLMANKNKSDSPDLCPASDEIEQCPLPCTCGCAQFADGKSLIQINCRQKNLTTLEDNFLGTNGKEHNGNTSGFLINVQVGGRSFLLQDKIGSLDLSSNNLQQLSSIEQSAPNLRQLLLSHNQFKIFPEETFRSLQDLRYYVTLGNNPWSCNCSAVGFRKWLLSKEDIVQDGNDILCSGTGRLVKSLSELELCPAYVSFYVTVSIVILGVLLSCSLVLMAWSRWKVHVRVWLWSKGMSCLKVRQGPDDEKKRFDAFLSFSHEDEAFVLGKVVPVIESRAPKVHLCLHYKHFMPGEYIQKNIFTAVENSKRTVIFLSRSFLESDWCLMEFKAAHTQAVKDRICRLIVIKLSDLPKDSIDPAIKMYLDSTTYLTWGEKHFWNNLLYSLPTSLAKSEQPIDAKDIPMVDI